LWTTEWADQQAITAGNNRANDNNQRQEIRALRRATLKLVTIGPAVPPIGRGSAVLDLWIRIGEHWTKAGMRDFACTSEREDEHGSTLGSVSTEGR
jgi:hypothetical protein